MDREELAQLQKGLQFQKEVEAAINEFGYYNLRQKLMQ